MFSRLAFLAAASRWDAEKGVYAPQPERTGAREVSEPASPLPLQAVEIERRNPGPILPSSYAKVFIAVLTREGRLAMSATASAPGKVILIGEHFVVEGEPALALALELRARARVRILRREEEDRIVVVSRELGLREVFPKEDPERSPLFPVYLSAKLAREHAGVEGPLEIRISSELPPASGMGSSAAVSVATAAAVLALGGALKRELVSSIAYEAEKIVHGKPSGIDNTISTYGGAILYERRRGFTRIGANLRGAKIVLADTGIPRPTGDLVRKVRELKARYWSILDPVYTSAGRLAVEAAKALELGDLATLGELMNISHGLLSAIGVSRIELEQLVYAARSSGALGAKITGAGGGGLVVALCRREDAERVCAHLREMSKRVFVAEIADKGVLLEELDKSRCYWER